MLIVFCLFDFVTAAVPNSLSSFTVSDSKLYLAIVISALLLYFPTKLLFAGVLPSSLRHTVLNSSIVGALMNSFASIRNRFSSDRPGSLSSKKLYRHALSHGGNVGGLINEGNTCFMNCVVQSLASSEDFVDFLSDCSSKFDESDEKGDLSNSSSSILNKIRFNTNKKLNFTQELNNLVSKLNYKHGKSNMDYNLITLAKKMSNGFEKHSFLGYNQEDAQEFFQLLISNLEKETVPKSESEKKKVPVEMSLEELAYKNGSLKNTGSYYIPASQIDPMIEGNKAFEFKFLTPADGLTVERIGCLTCGETGGLRYSVSSGLSLSLPSDSFRGISLDKILQEFIKEEIIEGVECNRCSLLHVTEFLKESLKKENLDEKLRKGFEDRITKINEELKKPIITDEVAAANKSKNVKQKGKKSKQGFLSKPPAYLSLHFNRSVFDLRTGYVRKNNCHIDFPAKLDLNDYVAGINDVNIDARNKMRKQDDIKQEIDALVGNTLQEESHMDVDLNEHQSDDSQSNESGKSRESLFENSVITDSVSDIGESSNEETEIIGSKEPKENDEHVAEKIKTLDEKLKSFHREDLVYNLKACIVHYGTHNYGHYIAFRKSRGVWWRISDETVEVVDESQVLQTPGVFMLFYENPNSLDESCELKFDENGEIEIDESIDKPKVEIDSAALREIGMTNIDISSDVDSLNEEGAEGASDDSINQGADRLSVLSSTEAVGADGGAVDVGDAASEVSTASEGSASNASVSDISDINVTATATATSTATELV